MNIRKVHRAVGVAFAPFFLVTSFTGMALLWRKAGVYGSGVKDTLLGLHNWEIAARYVGVVLAAGVVCMVATGLAMLVQGRKRGRQRDAAVTPGASFP